MLEELSKNYWTSSLSFLIRDKVHLQRTFLHNPPSNIGVLQAVQRNSKEFVGGLRFIVPHRTWVLDMLRDFISLP